MDNDKIEALYQWCKNNKDAIVEAAESGDTSAKTIITVHRLLVAFPDNAALGILQGAVTQFMASRPPVSGQGGEGGG